MNLIEKLSSIQKKMKAPKNLYNSFGKYHYRNAESILEAFKPFESEYNVALVIEDSIETVGDRFYLKSTAILLDCESNEKIHTSAFAREPISKKGMDESQVTGAASSYARKYALNGLFLLDDTKDADYDGYEKESKKDNVADKEKDSLLNELHTELKRCGYGEESVIKRYNVNRVEDMSKLQLKDCIEKVKMQYEKEHK